MKAIAGTGAGKAKDQPASAQNHGSARRGVTLRLALQLGAILLVGLGVGVWLGFGSLPTLDTAASQTSQSVALPQRSDWSQTDEIGLRAANSTETAGPTPPRAAPNPAPAPDPTPVPVPTQNADTRPRPPSPQTQTEANPAIQVAAAAAAGSLFDLIVGSSLISAGPDLPMAPVGMTATVASPTTQPTLGAGPVSPQGSTTGSGSLPSATPTAPASQIASWPGTDSRGSPQPATPAVPQSQPRARPPRDRVAAPAARPVVASNPPRSAGTTAQNRPAALRAPRKPAAPPRPQQTARAPQPDPAPTTRRVPRLTVVPRGDLSNYRVVVIPTPRADNLIGALQARGYEADLHNLRPQNGRFFAQDSARGLRLSRRLPVDVAKDILRIAKDEWPFLEYIYTDKYVKRRASDDSDVMIGTNTGSVKSHFCAVPDEDFDVLTSPRLSEEEFYAIIGDYYRGAFGCRRGRR